MDKALSAIEQFGKKVGVLAAILVAYLFFEIQELNEKVERLDRTANDLAEVRESVSAINAKLQILLDDYSSKRYMQNTDPSVTKVSRPHR